MKIKKKKTKPGCLEISLQPKSLSGLIWAFISSLYNRLVPAKAGFEGYRLVTWDLYVYGLKSPMANAVLKPYFVGFSHSLK